jgi:hypothetical protein
MRISLERFSGERICEKRGHNFSERRLRDIEGMVFVEYACLRCRKHYQEIPTAMEMEKYYDQTNNLFV